MRRSAGILLFRRNPEVQILLGHMGGPFWARKDDGAWTIPKGEYTDEETAEQAARREFEEELGLPVPAGELVDLGEVKQSGKVVTVWALEGDIDLEKVVLGTFDMEWPKGSGKIKTFPELDRVAWFGLEDARAKVVSAQRAFLDRISPR
ncbi:NUDIX domain-containing protein [Lentzea tibetensis]|uniref:NUDIX domain-containing protein n=1 Tax=Lentzea tibetensis TaxID=2591470 RepID=A0A563EK92_9PSEU|nr:NUDIX domain-containing protein [Lentzea tibetensis]TWP46510.1 NUDIX domain-containing protein [Lentzea tibetensis]